MSSSLPFKLQYRVNKDRKCVTRQWSFCVDGEYEESVVLVYSFGDGSSKIYENEELVSVGKGTIVEWRSDSGRTRFRIEGTDSEDCAFSINGVEFDRIRDAPGEDKNIQASAQPRREAKVADSSTVAPQVFNEQATRDALIKAVAQWKEVRNPNSNGNNSTNVATATTTQPSTEEAKRDKLDETQTVPTELLQMAAKLTKDRDDALRRLKEWEASGGSFQDDQLEDQNGTEDEEDVIEEDFVTETLGEVWEKQQLGLLPRDPAMPVPTAPAQPLAGASPPTSVHVWAFDLDLCNLENTVVRNEFDVHYVRAFEDVFFRLTNDVASLKDFAGTALLAPLNVALSGLNVHAQVNENTANTYPALPHFSWHALWEEDFAERSEADEGVALGVGEFKLDWTFQVTDLIESYLEYNVFSKRNTAEATNAYAAVVQMNHNMRMYGVKYGILTTLKQTWVFRRAGESELFISEKFGQADIVKVFLSTLVTSVVESATGRDQEEEDGSQSVHSDQDRIENSPGTYLEDSQVIAESVEYEGAAISVLEARQILGLAEYSAKIVSHYIVQNLADESGEISLSLYTRGMNKLVGDKYAAASVLTRSKIDFVLARLFEVCDEEGTGFANAVELACALLLFCGDDALVRSRVAWELLEGDAARGRPLNFDAVVRAVSSLIKAQLCLDPSLTVETYLSAVEVRANLEASAFYPNQTLGKLVSAASHFLELFSCTLFMCQSEAMDLELEKYQTAPKVNVPSVSKSKGTPEGKGRSPQATPEALRARGLDVPSRSPAQNKNDDDDDEEVFVTDVKDDFDLPDNESEESDHNNSRPGMLSLRSFSLDNLDSEEEEEDNIFLNDQHFPPSAVVLELRAARAILGLENYCADEMMAVLAEHSPGGQLSESGWIRWLSFMSHVAKTPVQDLDIAINLGNLLFAAFDDSSSSSGSPVKGAPREGQIAYERMAAGLAFLCGGSPLEERLMVAFTVMDADSDGCITPVELLEIIKSALLVISVCSRMVADKILLLGAPVEELAEAAAIEAVSALNVDNTAAYITLEMLCEAADDFLKLAALF